MYDAFVDSKWPIVSDVRENTHVNLRIIHTVTAAWSNDVKHLDHVEKRSVWGQ